MPPQDNAFFSQQLHQALCGCKQGWTVLRTRGPGKITFWFIALLVGIAAGFAALFFRKGINWLQATLYGTDDVQFLHSFLAGLPWYWVVLIPTLGGLLVGLILHRFTRDGRARSVGDVILGAALHDGRVETSRRGGLGIGLAYHSLDGRLIRPRRAGGASGRRDLDQGQPLYQGRWDHRA